MEKRKDIIAYHHTTKEAYESIKEEGFNEKYFHKVHSGYGVQCFLKKHDKPMIAGKEEGQIVVHFNNCRVLRDKKIIYESQIKSQRAETYEKQREIAKKEAERLKGLGYDAFILRVFEEDDGILFLNYPQVVEWLPF